MSFEKIKKRIAAAHAYHDKKSKELHTKDPCTQSYLKRLNRLIKYNSLTSDLIKKMLDEIFDEEIDSIQQPSDKK